MVELMIGVLLLALILVPSLNVMIGQTQAVNATRDHSQAAFLAERILETARSFDFKMLDEERPDNEEDKKKTLEHRLKNDPEYNKYFINDIEYNLDPDFTSVDPIEVSGALEDSLPTVYALKYSIVYTGKDGRNHRLNIHTVLSQR